MTAPYVAPRSSFVTALAWSMILLNGLSILGALMQTTLVELLLPVLAASQADAGLAPPALPMGLLRTLGLLSLALAVFMTWSAWALLQRRDWARRLYVSLFVLGIAGNVLGGIAWWAGSRLVDPAMLGLGDAPETARAALRATNFLVAVLVVGFSILYAWIVRRLRSPEVRAEFQAATAGPR